MHPLYTYYQAAVTADQAHEATQHRRARRARRDAARQAEAIAIRAATPADAAGINRLATLDGTRAPEGEMLIAEVDGVLAAAVAVGGGRAIADPFRPTREAIALLCLHAAQLREHGDASGGGLVRRAVRAARRSGSRAAA